MVHLCNGGVDEEGDAVEEASWAQSVMMERHRAKQRRTVKLRKLDAHVDEGV